MKLITILYLISTSSLLFSLPPTYIASAPISQTTTVIASPALEVYLGKLSLCESRNNPFAENPKDLDGTPSLGLYQFKIKSFNYFSSVYNIATTSIWNGAEQKDIVTRMAQDPKVDFHRQFPGCTNKLGLPPA